MLKNRGIAFKQILFILIISAVIFSCIFSYNYYTTKNVIINKLKNDASVLTNSINYQLEQVFLSSEKNH